MGDPKMLQIAQLRTELDLPKCAKAAGLNGRKFGRAPADIHRNMQIIFHNRGMYRNAQLKPSKDLPLAQRPATAFTWRPVREAALPHFRPQWDTLGSKMPSGAGLPSAHTALKQSVPGRVSARDRTRSRDRSSRQQGKHGTMAQKR